MKKKKLVIATDNFLPRWDGVARFLSEVIPGLSEEFSITVVGPDYGPVKDKRYRFVKIPLNKKRFGDFQPGKVRYKRVKKEVKQANLVFTQTIGPIGASAIVAAKRSRTPLACYIHSMEDQLVPMAMGPTPLRRLLYPLMRRYTRHLYNKANLLLTPSEWVSEQLSWNGIRTPCTVVRMGVDTEKFSPGSAKEVRGSLGVEEDDVVIGQHGRLAREKDLKTLLRAFIRLRAKHKHLKLLIVAEGLPWLKKVLESQEGVILPGKQDDIVPYIRAMDIFCLTSLTETTSLSALEAMSTGRPIVSTPVGFVRDYIKDGENGFFFPFRDTVTLSKKLEWLINHPTLRSEMGEKARETIKKDFVWSETTKGIAESLTRLSE